MLYKLLAAMDHSRFECSVISLMDTGVHGSRIEKLGVPVYTLNMKEGRPSLAALWRLIRTSRKLRPDVIQGWMYHGNLAATVAQKVTQSHPIVLWNIRQTLYGLEYEKRLSRLVIRANVKFSRSVSRIVYNSSLSASQHEAIGFEQRRRVLIPNGFEVDRFKPSADSRARIRADLCIDENSVVVGIIGRSHPMKDHANFVRAATQINTHRPDIHFVLVGPGLTEDNQELGSFVRASGAGDVFHFLGERTDIPEIMGALDVFVLCSAWGEAFPNVLGEAMSCGLACVATDVGDSAYILSDCGIVVSPRNTDELAEAILKLIELTPDQRQALGVQARKRILTEFSINGVASQYEALYKDVVAEKNTKK